MATRRTTDPQNERFDRVDKLDKVIGTLTRSQAHTDPTLIHRAIGILLFNSKGQLFLQKRSMTKDTYPGHWTVSVSGHVRKGQTYQEAARAELWEELGIAEPITLTKLEKTLRMYPNETEYQALYRAEYSGPVAVNLQEITQGKFFRLNQRFFLNTIKKIKLTPELEYALKRYIIPMKQASAKTPVVPGSSQTKVNDRRYTNDRRMHLLVGDPAPDFSAPDQTGEIRRLAEFKGKYLLLYFYPKDFTSGCTREACEFRDHFEDLGKNLAIVGVSSDAQAIHAKFAEKYNLHFPLLADPGRTIITSYGANGIVYAKRTSFLIDPEGSVVRIFTKVNPKIHAKEVMNEVER